MPRKNYSKVSTKKSEEKQLTIDEMDLVEKVEDIKGCVDGCENLRVREEPSKEANVLSIIKKAEIVTVDIDNSKRDFYKVKTQNGVEGYCMKKFIKIK